MSVFRFSLYLLLTGCGLFSSCFGLYEPIQNETPAQQPWFTGPLLTPSARVIPVGHFNLEPYLYWTLTTGKYDHNWSVLSAPKFYQLNPLLVFKIGIINRVDFGGIIQGYYSKTQGKSSAAFGDLPLGFEIQLVDQQDDSWVPFVKLALLEVFPTGKYEKLNPGKLGTDIGGQGAYATSASITISKMFTYPEHHFLNVRWNFAANFPSNVHVKGVNSYGGDSSTHGHVHPGTSYTFQNAAEYNLTQRWTIALDLQASFSERTTFKGHSKTPVGSPSSVQLSAAPAIEYNWTDTMGIIVGSWFTFAGRNSARFVSIAAAYNYYY